VRPTAARCASGFALAALLGACSDYKLNPHEEDVGVQDPSCAELEPPAGLVEVDGTCLFEPVPGTFSPVVEWQWSADSGAPGYDDVMMMPAVGDVNADGMPDIVVTAYAGTGYGSAGALVILAGNGAGEEASFTNIGGHLPLGSAGVALGDLDGDRVVEIVTISTDARVLALHADGTLVWASEPRGQDFTVYSYPVIADLDGDGLAEVIVGRDIFRSDGTLRAVGAYGWGGNYAISTAIDLDDDGIQEVVVGNAAYNPDGSAKWYNPSVPDGWVAIGDFDADGEGEVASVSWGQINLLDTDGTLIWGPNPVPGGGGGPPTVADFDGDGEPEVGVAGFSGYVVYDTDGTQLWLQTTTDYSSAQTGSSVFDFEGDGAYEVVYADELVLWVYDGATGAPVLAEEGHSSWTLFEYPLVADVDADGEAEIVLGSNDSIASGWQGVTVVGDASRSWAPTAPVWNQHAFYITNVNDDLSIPPHPTPNWFTGHNSFRAGGVREAPGLPAPDLSALTPIVCWDCDADSVWIYTQVLNTGTLDIDAALPVDLYRRSESGEEALISRQTVEGGVRSGRASDALLWKVPVATVETDDTFVARVDPDGAVEECDESDNDAATPEARCE
jgi:hypothetical protein